MCRRFRHNCRCICRAGSLNHADQMRKPEEANSDICRSPNPASRAAPLAPPRFAPAQATLGRLSRTGAVAMVTPFLSSLAPRAQENCAIIPYFGWEKRDGNGGRGRERERNGVPNAYIIQICSHLPSFHTFRQFPPFSPSVSRAVFLSLSLLWVNTFSNNSRDDASLCW